MPIPTILLDANVLVPLSVRDTILRAAEAGLCQVRWTDAILSEVERTLVRQRLTTAAQAARLLEVMRTAFPDASITGYEPSIDQMTNDPKDRHVTAAARHAHVDLIVTNNLRDFHERDLEPFNLRAIHPDDLLLRLLRADPDVMLGILQQQERDRRKPPQTLSEILDGLAVNVPRFVATIRQRLAVP